MRFIIYGVGAIGGTLAAALTLRHENVLGIARGAQLEAINANGLLFRTPHFSERVRFPCVAAPADISFAEDDVVLLTMKSQDTGAAMLALRDAGVTTQPIFCAQNGVANEPTALRWFPNVYGVTVMMPADYVVPGEVNNFSTPSHGIFEIGRYPGGSDDIVESVCSALQAANIAAFASPDVMAAKYGKLLENLGNVIDAALGSDEARQRLTPRVREEALAVYAAAGIGWRDVTADTPQRRQLMQLADIEGVTRTGSSSRQSLARGTGSIETDYLNGEIVLLGRLHGIPTPLNAELCRIGREIVSGRPGSVGPQELERRLDAAAA